jgi:hypothetical protein
MACLCVPAYAADLISVTIAPDDSEIITTDLKRIRPAETTEIRFKVTTGYIEQVFGKDLSIPRAQMRLAVLSSARRVLGAMTGAQATAPEAARAIVAQVDRDLSHLGVAVEQHTLRYVFLPGYAP